MAFRLILASTSRYRRELLARLGLDFATMAPAVDETPEPGEAPDALARRLARAKAAAVGRPDTDSLIIGSDQVAALGDTLLGKPGNRENNLRQLQACAGRTVRFYTAVHVVNTAEGEGHGSLDITSVTFRPLGVMEIERYVDREQPYDCAGGFKAEGLGISLFERIESEDPTALIGLPLIRLVRLLGEFGVAIP
jgi:septum formation protein